MPALYYSFRGSGGDPDKISLNADLDHFRGTNEFWNFGTDVAAAIQSVVLLRASLRDYIASDGIPIVRKYAPCVCRNSVLEAPTPSL